MGSCFKKLLIIGTTAMLTLFILLIHMFFLQQEVSVSMSLVKTKYEPSLIPAINIGLVTIATNGYNASWLVETALIKGLFEGHIFIVSDAETQYYYRETDNIIKDNRINISTDRKVIERLSPSYIKVDRPIDSLAATSLKSKVFELISQHDKKYKKIPPEINRLLYCDADMAVNRDMRDFVSQLTHWDPSCSIYLTRERLRTQLLLLLLLFSKQKLSCWLPL